MARDNKGFMCHEHHEMVSFEIHHVWPLGYHGPNISSNKIKICPNAHSDIHFLLEEMLKGHDVDFREYGPLVRLWARKGYKAVIDYGDWLAQRITKAT